ncbi:MAG: glycosyltransferase [Hyphomonadaceae bacterium]|nr:glycosyltransferase [Hyphomonadaceae bacterium]
MTQGQQMSMEVEGSARSAILVLGMHRSGTSALTRGLEALGVELGGNLKPPVAEDNEKGFFEDWTLSTINDDLLALTGEQWDSLTASDGLSPDHPRVKQLKLQALEYLDREFSHAPVIGFKDPRSCRHAWFWDDVFVRNGRRPLYVIAFRNPMEVARSLNKRNGFPPQKSYYLWLVHYLRAMRDTVPRRRVAVEYGELIASPRTVLTRIVEKLAIAGISVSQSKLTSYERDFLDSRLRHQAFAADALELDPACSRLVADVYGLLKRQAAGEEDVSGLWDAHIAAFAGMAPHFDFFRTEQANLAREKTEAQRALVEQEHSLSQRAAAEKESALAALAVEKDTAIALLSRELEETKALAAAAAVQASREKEVALTALAADRDGAIDRLSRELQDVRAAGDAQAAQWASEREAALAALAADRDVMIARLSRELQAVRAAGDEAAAQWASEHDAALAALSADKDAMIALLYGELDGLRGSAEAAAARWALEVEQERAAVQDLLARERAQFSETVAEAIAAERARAEQQVAEAVQEAREEDGAAARRALEDAVLRERARHAEFMREVLEAERELAHERAASAIREAQADAHARVAAAESSARAMEEQARERISGALQEAERQAARAHEAESDLDALAAAFADVERDLRAREALLARSVESEASERAEHERARRESARREEEVRALVERRRHQINHLSGALAIAVSERQQLATTLRAVYASTSWRLTYPVRQIKRWLSGRSDAQDQAPLELSPVQEVSATYSVDETSPVLERARGRRLHFTICARNYLPIARTCLETSQRHHPDAEHVLVLCDEVQDGYDPVSERFRVIVVGDLGLEALEDMSWRYDVMELSTAIKPFCFSHFFAAGFDEVVYLDPDLFFLAPLSAVAEAFTRGAEAVVTPHINKPIWDDKRPNDHDMLRAGVYNLGFLALRKSHAASEFARWWGERLKLGAASDPDRGYFTDQKWCDLLPCFVSRTEILDHPGYNLAYWNLMHRPVARVGQTWTAGGQPVCFAHFSGASFSDPDVFSKHQNRYDAQSIGALLELYDAYREQVRANGFGSGPNYTYAFDFDKAGRRIAPVVRRLYRNEFAPNKPPSRVNADDIVAFANAQTAAVKSFGSVKISRVLHQIWRERSDLQAAFDLNSEDGQRALVDWAVSALPREYQLDERFYPLTGGVAAEPAASLLNHASALRPLYRHLPEGIRKRAREALLGATRRDELRPGAALIGYARGELGMGEHVRMTAASLQTQGVPFGIVNVSTNVLARQEDRRFDHLFDADTNFRANIFHVNADQLPQVTQELGDRAIRRRVNVAYPAWELSIFPDEWTPQINAMDEIWAPSEFVRAAIAAKTTRPVVRLPLAVELAEGFSRWRRSDFDIPADAFVFMFHFDLASYSSRKNPSAVVSAFRRAFDGMKGADPKPILLIKALSAERFGQPMERLIAMTSGDERMQVIAGTLAPDQMHGLMNSIDVFVSLHRSEGFGRGPAEAMRMGKAVIATGYSGNLDYMNESNSFLVPYGLRELAPDDYPFASGQQWADPDLDAAAEMMRMLYWNPELAKNVGRMAAAYMEKHHSKEAAGARYRERLERIGAL